MDSLPLERTLRHLFIEYGPKLVSTTWDKTLNELRESLREADTPLKIEMKNQIVEPLTAQAPLKVSFKPFQSPDKDAQKEKMRLHREAVSKKRQELASKGVIPETQLTEENLKKWIQHEKKNYWTIAEETGCNDSDVSIKAKSLNILSDLALMIRKKKAQI